MEPVICRKKIKNREDRAGESDEYFNRRTEQDESGQLSDY